jgi:hypothetical protein
VQRPVDTRRSEAGLSETVIKLPIVTILITDGQRSYSGAESKACTL